MWIFEKGLETIDVKKYKEKIGKEPIKSITESMARDYFYSLRYDKLLIKYRLQDIVNDIDKVTTISIVISLVGLILGNISKQYNDIINGIIIVLYVTISVYLIDLVKYYRACKLYLQIIKDIDEGGLNPSDIK